MPSLSGLPSKINQNKFIKALERLDFTISRKGGKGSHFKATYNSNQKSITIPEDLEKNVLYYVLKEIELYTGVTWDQIKAGL